MNLLALPVLFPLFTGALLLLLPGSELRRWTAALSAAFTAGASLSILSRNLGGEVLVVQMANWPAPWGITLVADTLTGLMLSLCGVVGLLTVLFAGSSLKHSPRAGQSARLNVVRERVGFQALLQFLFMGVNMSFLTGDLFNLFVAFEVILIASYGLLLVGNELPQLREGFKYVVVNLTASAIFVVAAGFAYGLFGTLNMADIAVRLSAHGPDPRVMLVAALLALVFATKAAVFPLGFWLPNSYPAPAAPASAFFAAMLTKVGAYALIRSFTLMFPQETGVQAVLLALTGFTMLIGGFGAITRQRWRHALAFANVASIGYLLMGVFAGSAAGLSAALYYTLHSVLLIFALFLVAALAEQISGASYRDEGHLAVYPWLGLGFFVLALGLAGIPPTSGFVGKYALIAALLEGGGPLRVSVAVAAVVTGLLLLYAVVQIWQGFFWGESDAVSRRDLPAGQSVVMVTAAGLVITLALLSGPAYRVTALASKQLSGNAAYLAAVLVPAELPDPQGGEHNSNHGLEQGEGDGHGEPQDGSGH